MRNVPAMDATGLHALEELARKCSRSGTLLILSEVSPQPMRTIMRAHKVELFGRDHRAKTFEAAVELATAQVTAEKSAPAATP